MTQLAFSWLCVPYLVCTAAIFAVALAAALIRGDRVLRIGVIGAAVTALPWALCQALAACTTDPDVATRVLRLGQGPVSMVGPNLMLVLLAVSGQLERYRWIARIAGLIGAVSLIVCWGTDLVVPGVQRIGSGMFYIAPGPLTGVHVSQLILWLLVGLTIVRRSTPRADRSRMLRLLLGVLIASAVGSLDTLLLYRVWDLYPIAWFPATVAACIALYSVLRTDLVRPQGFDSGVAIEMIGFGATALGIGFAAIALPSASPLGLAALGAVIWTIASAVTWGIATSRRTGVANERALEQFVARVGAIDQETKIAERVTALWKKTIGIAVTAVWWADGDALVKIGATERWQLKPEVASWLVRHGDALSITDLATMRLGALRTKIEHLGLAHGASWIIPLVDRDELVGLVEASYDKALRDEERALIAESARAAARALTFVGLARAAARERETAREVEIADALRLQAAASRDAQLGKWVVAAEYRTAARTTGAGWSAVELSDGKLALLVTEAQAHGVAAAFATAALTGAFAAATAGGKVTLDELIDALQATSEGVMRVGQPVAAFVAILDGRTVEWACAGHPGAHVVGPIAAIDAAPLGSTTGPRPQAFPLRGEQRPSSASLTAARRETSQMPSDRVLVVASSGLRGDDDDKWALVLRDTAPAAGRLASQLVETVVRLREPTKDLLAVVVRSR